MSFLEHCRKLASLRLKFRIATNVMLGDEDVRNGSLVSHLFKSVLNGSAISYMTVYQPVQACICNAVIRRDPNIQTWSSSIVKNFAFCSVRRVFAALQYGQYDLLKTAGEKLGFI